MSQDSQFNWLHLSDFHYKTGGANIARQKNERDSIIEDIEGELATKRVSLDCIVITGDLVYSGKAAEYVEFLKLIEELEKVTNVPRNNIYIIPGNHDANRTEHNTSWKCFTCCLQDEKLIENLFESPDDNIRVFANQQNYMDFQSTHFPDLQTKIGDQIFYLAEHEKNGRMINFLGLNTAWISKGGNEERKIIMGDYQIEEAISRIESKDLVIGLMHHPFNWLRKFDEDAIKNKLISNCHFILHGHEHDDDLTMTIKPGRKTCIISSGSAYEKKPEYLAYNYVEFDLRSMKGKMSSRKKPAGADWGYSYHDEPIDLSNRIESNKRVYNTYTELYGQLSSIEISLSDFNGTVIEYIKLKSRQSLALLPEPQEGYSQSTKLSILYPFVDSLDPINELLDEKIDPKQHDEIKKGYLNNIYDYVMGED